MTLKERIENEREVNRPVDGKFTKKPKDAKTQRRFASGCAKECVQRMEQLFVCIR